MAVDSAILRAVSQGSVLPTLRLYDWAPPCLSLGYNQPISDVDQTQLNAEGWDLVRRPTGGRAILHVDELTYAVIGLKSDPRLEGGILASYQRLAQALAGALVLLGLPVETQEKKNPAFDPNQPICFEFPSDFEITAHGKKIIGSAQARKGEGVLQHGSLPLHGDLTRITRVLQFPSSETRSRAGFDLLQKAATAESISGRAVTWQEAAEAFQRAFSNSLNIHLVEEELTTEELDHAEQLVDTQYGHPDWTWRK